MPAVPQPLSTPLSALLVGATGLVGSELLQLLLADARFDPVITLTRRPLPEAMRSPKLKAHVIDFDAPETWADFCRADAVFCALGTTIKTAGSREAFRRVDHDYPVAVGRAARERGAQHYLLVSALGSKASSPFFYSRVKGEVEEDLRRQGWPRLTIVRPSLLLGDRAEFRPLEKIFGALAPLTIGNYKPVHANAVARCMIARALAPGADSVEVIESAEIRKLGR